MDTLLPGTRTIESLNGYLAAWDEQERALIESKNPQGDGGMYQRERIETAARWACERFDGDLVEIGCLNGSTTVRLADVAREYGRRVIAIDPFEPETQNVSADTFDIFTKTTAPYADVIEFMRESSDTMNVVETLEARILAFSFVDGLHQYDAVLVDMANVRHSGLIALDDTRTMKEVRDGFWGFTNRHRSAVSLLGKILEKPYWRETYILQTGGR